ncbi:MAG: fibronectin type III domain-containing protein [Candidatus Firestonebacteria bacterium]|nr:fibronectin type III domain-containing protein [Candidatus Firestonebacteria bacterium]
MKHQNKLIFIIYYILLYSILFVTIILSISCAEKKEKKVVETDTTAPSAPDNLTAYATTDVINLYWDKNQETDIEKYRVYRSNSTIPTLPAKKTSQLYNTNFSNNGYVEETGTSYADTDISFGVTYYYRVSALDKSSNESNKSNQVQVTYGDHTPPAKPALLTALPGTRQGEVSLAWALNTEPDLLSYNIYISDSGGITYNFLASSKSNSYTVKDLSPDTEYYFYITALDTSKNESLSSNLVVSKPYGDITPPLKPALLTALPGTRQGEVSLAWTLNIESDLMSYNIYKSDSSGGIRTYLGTSTTNSYTVK